MEALLVGAWGRACGVFNGGAPIISFGDGKAGERGCPDKQIQGRLFNEQQERIPPAPSGQGGADERLAAGAGGGSGGAEEEGKRPILILIF